MEDVRDLLKEVKGKYEALCIADRNYDLSPLTPQNQSARKEYSQLYLDWYASAYELMCRFLDYNADIEMFRSVMKENDGVASSLKDNFHKIEAAYKGIIQTIEKKLPQ